MEGNITTGERAMEGVWNGAGYGCMVIVGVGTLSRYWYTWVCSLPQIIQVHGGSKQATSHQLAPCPTQ